MAVLPATPSDEATLFAGRLRTGVEKLQIPEISGGVTLSIGVAICDSPDVTVDALLKKADGAMYQSKNGGRNRVTLVGTHAEESVGEAVQGDRLPAKQAQGGSAS